MQVLLIFFFVCALGQSDCEMTQRLGAPQLVETSKSCAAFLDSLPPDPRIIAPRALVPPGKYPRVACIDLGGGEGA